MSEKKTMTIEVDVEKESVVIIAEDQPDAKFFGNPHNDGSAYLWALINMEDLCKDVWMQFMKFFIENVDTIRRDMVKSESKVVSKRN